MCTCQRKDKLPWECDGNCASNWRPERSSTTNSARKYSNDCLRSHIISIGTDGKLSLHRKYAGSKDHLTQIFCEGVPGALRGCRQKRIVIYADGGLGEEPADEKWIEWIDNLMKHQIYPLAIVWNENLLKHLYEPLGPAIEKYLGPADSTHEDSCCKARNDRIIEGLAKLKARWYWIEIKEKALSATISDEGGARVIAKQIEKFVRKNPRAELHFVAHGAGSIFQSRLIQLIATKGFIQTGHLAKQVGFGIPISSVTLFAPACTVESFKETYLPLVAAGQIKQLTIFALSDAFEQKDHGWGRYKKSPLCLISNGLEGPMLPPELENLDPVPIVGMERYIMRDKTMHQFKGTEESGKLSYVIAPNAGLPRTAGASRAAKHADFIDDPVSWQAVLAPILGPKPESGAA